jgi:c-di-GMP-binding flagellar brake protein YcgR
MEERRKYPRIKYELVVEYNVSNQQQPVETISQDISEGGICLITREFLQTGIPVDLHFFIPDSATPIKVTGIVTWNEIKSDGNKFLNGIKFIRMDETQLDLIQKFINSVTFEVRRNHHDIM